MTTREKTHVIVDAELDSAPSEDDHLACCKADWDTALCGADVSNEPIVLIVDSVCRLCAEIVVRNYQALGVNPFEDSFDDRICFVDGDPCPPEEVVEQRVIDRVLRD